jgi:catechol 2,3-dioxygenase-like lactoylglutathione lyase family enzyme
MPLFRKLTPNLIVADVERSLAFYADVLGFSRGLTVPDAPPFVFGSVTSNTVEVFFNEVVTAVKEYPALAGRPLGASGTMFIEMDDVEAYHASLQGKVTITMPLVTQWYGLKEFAIVDPDGYLITFAERVQQP